MLACVISLLSQIKQSIQYLNKCWTFIIFGHFCTLLKHKLDAFLTYYVIGLQKLAFYTKFD